MSSALLKKSLQIVEETYKEDPKTNKNKDKHKAQDKDLKRLGDKKTEKNIDELKKVKGKKIKNGGIDKSTAELLFNYALGRSIPEQNKKKKKEESIFTDEDFNKFEKEYFG